MFWRFLFAYLFEISYFSHFNFLLKEKSVNTFLYAAHSIWNIICHQTNNFNKSFVKNISGTDSLSMFVCLCLTSLQQQRSFRDGTLFTVPCERTWSSGNTPFPPGIELRAVARQSIMLPLRHASSTQFVDKTSQIHAHLYIIYSNWMTIHFQSRENSCEKRQEF